MPRKSTEAATTTPPIEPTPSVVAGFERSLDELEQLVQRMEKGEMSLDESLHAYERGVALYRQCQGALQQAELRVRLLSDLDDPDNAGLFAPDAD
jgi:exodeoxyribonuclease VII small subunit